MNCDDAELVRSYNRRMPWTRLSKPELHGLLLDRRLSPRYRSAEWIAGQALFCPYYVPLEGRLGADWGVIVNPDSDRFALLTLEHDDCGCPGRVDRGDGPVHDAGVPAQQGDTWDADWRHECNEFCENPCGWREGSP